MAKKPRLETTADVVSFMDGSAAADAGEYQAAMAADGINVPDEDLPDDAVLGDDEDEDDDGHPDDDSEEGAEPVTLNPREVPVPPALAAKLMERDGRATDKAESPKPSALPGFAPGLTPILLKLAADALDEKEWSLFTGTLGGEPIERLAARVKLTKASAVKLLDKATDKVRALLIEEALRHLAEDFRKGTEAVPGDGWDAMRSWFRGGLVASKTHQWLPLAALLFMAAAANEDRELTYADAYRVVGAKPVVSAAISTLRGLGFVDVNITTGKIRILKLPTDAPRAPAKAVAA